MHEVKSRGLVCPIGISILRFLYFTGEINGLGNEINDLLIETNVSPQKNRWSFTEVTVLLM